MTAFQKATRLAVEAWGNDPHWEELLRPGGDKQDLTGAPYNNTHGVDLSDSPMVYYDLRLRRQLRWRTGIVTVTDPQASTTYEVSVQGNLASITSQSSGSDAELTDDALTKLARETNSLQTEYRAITRDTDDDNEHDELELRSNHSAITVDSASDNQDYTLNIDGTEVTYTSGTGASIDSVTAGLAAKIRNSLSIASAQAEDTDNDSDVEMFFVWPNDHETLSISVVTGSMTVQSRGSEQTSPPVSLPSAVHPRQDLSLDADEVSQVRFYGTWEGESEPPGGWRLIDEIHNIDYRGATGRVLVGGRAKGAVEIAGPDSGELRSVQIGYPTLG